MRFPARAGRRACLWLGGTPVSFGRHDRRLALPRAVRLVPASCFGTRCEDAIDGSDLARRHELIDANGEGGDRHVLDMVGGPSMCLPRRTVRQRQSCSARATAISTLSPEYISATTAQERAWRSALVALIDTCAVASTPNRPAKRSRSIDAARPAKTGPWPGSNRGQQGRRALSA